MTALHQTNPVHPVVKLRPWQQKIIDDYDLLIKRHRSFILKAPTGAGKTLLASEIIDRFYDGRKVIVLCHRLVLLEQLEEAFAEKHRVRKLSLSDEGPAFNGYEILLSTNMRCKDVLSDALRQADLVIVDEAHRVSPNGDAYKRIIEIFNEDGKDEARLIGLTASPERRTGDQKDQLGLIFDSIIDCADIHGLIEQGILVKPEYRPHFIHDLDLNDIDISAGDFPVAKLSPEIIRSSMIEYSASIYLEERENVSPKPISAWFCADVAVAEKTYNHVCGLGISAEIVTAKTPIRERMDILARHEAGEVEALMSVGVLSEGWDNPNCNIIVHLRPTLSKVLWGQTVGRGLRSAPNKEKCIVIDVSSNWSTFGPVEDLEWTLWNHRKSFMKFKNRFNWITDHHDKEDDTVSYLICEGTLPDRRRCSYIYKKNTFSEETCPKCGSYAAIDIYKEKKVDTQVNDIGLHRIFFERVPKVYAEMNTSIWKELGRSAWKDANKYEHAFLSFCAAFEKVSGEETTSESDYWDVVLDAEAKVRAYLVRNKFRIPKSDEFDLSYIVDGLQHGKNVRTLPANFGISQCGLAFEELPMVEVERKYQKAHRIAERLIIMGSSGKERLPYFDASRDMYIDED